MVSDCEKTRINLGIWNILAVTATLVKFTEWTRDDRLRQPVFIGLREDKNPSEVVREKES